MKIKSIQNYFGKFRDREIIVNLAGLTIVGFTYILLTFPVWKQLFIWAIEGGAWRFFVLPASLYMVYQKRESIKSQEIRPDILLGGIGILVSISIFLIGHYSYTQVLLEFATVLLIPFIILTMFGWNIVKITMWPTIYLLMMTSILDEVLNHFIYQFQLVSAIFATGLLHVFAIPVIRDGVYIRNAHMVLEVAEGCSGLNHLISLIALSIPIAYFTQKKMWKGILFVVFASILSFFLNAFRIFLIGISTHFYPTDQVHGPFNILIVHFTFVVAVVFLLFVGLKFRDTDSKATSLPPGSRPDIKNEAKNRGIALFLSRLIIISLLFLSFCFIELIRIKPVPPVVVSKDLTNYLSDYIVTENNFDDFWKSTENSDSEIRCTITSNESKRSYLFFYEYYSSQSDEKELISYETRALFKNGEEVQIHTTGQNTGISRKIVNDTTIFAWFVIDNRVYSNPLKAKIKTLFNSLVFGRNNGTLVVVKMQQDAAKNGWNDDVSLRLLSKLVKFSQTPFHP